MNNNLKEVYNCPKVSVCMITYNHEKYIADAIEGVLLQRTNFPIELIISDDCSNDSTRSIIKKYHKEYPDIIKPDFPIKNKGMMLNFKDTLLRCSGEYLALCEGDDYWVDPLKLQKQVDLLESNKNCVLCFHDVNVLTNKGIVKSFIHLINPKFELKEKLVSFSEVISSRWLIPTCSVVFRKNHLDLPDWYCSLPNGDYPLFCLLAMEGEFQFIPKPMGVYRMNNLASMVNQRNLFDRLKIINKNISFLTNLLELVNPKHKLDVIARLKSETDYMESKINLLKSNKVIYNYLKFSKWLQRIKK